MLKNSKLFPLFALLLVLAFLVTACGPAEEPDVVEEPAGK